MMKKLFLSVLICCLGGCFSAYSQNFPAEGSSEVVQRDPKDAYKIPNVELDTIKVSSKPAINNYMLLGVYGGVGGGLTFWNPSMKQDLQFLPICVGFTFTHYEKMFGFLPYFGFQAGAEFCTDGYRLRKGYEVYGFTAVRQQVIHAYYQGHMHFDFWKMKAIVNIGLYAGYRLAINRWNEYDPEQGMEQYRRAFAPSDYRFDYGIRAGVGFGFVFDPIELHITATYKHSLQSIYHPDYLSKDYYRFANPMAFYLSVGIHYQISNRIGKTRQQLKSEARDIYDKSYFDGAYKSQGR
ncbi:MAG: hypothetical protein HUJ95_00090 [Bacteroidales bacterium]|nr:hypothetical protein [Bacteroidales bacterium]